MNHDALMLYFSNSFSRRRVPIVPAQIPMNFGQTRSDINDPSDLELPLLISLVLSSPPYDPSQPATASISTP